MWCLPHRRELEDRASRGPGWGRQISAEEANEPDDLGSKGGSSKLFGRGSSQLRACTMGMDLVGEGSLSPEVCKPDLNLHQPKREPPATGTLKL